MSPTEYRPSNELPDDVPALLVAHQTRRVVLTNPRLPAAVVDREVAALLAAFDERTAVRAVAG